MNTNHDALTSISVRQIGFLFGVIGTFLIFLGCYQIYENWVGWSLDELKEIRFGVLLIFLGIGVLALPFLVIFALGSYFG